VTASHSMVSGSKLSDSGALETAAAGGGGLCCALGDGISGDGVASSSEALDGSTLSGGHPRSSSLGVSALDGNLVETC